MENLVSKWQNGCRFILNGIFGLLKKDGSKIIFLCLVSLFIFSPSLFYFFHQDDFFNLYVSQAKTLSEFLNFFKFRNDVIFYRPLSIQVYFWLSQKIFGLNPLGFHFLGMAFHFLNIILVYVLVLKISKSRLASFLSSFFYATANFQFIALFWISEFSMIIGPTFYLSSVIAYMKFSQKKRKLWWLTSFLMFILGLLSTEMMVSLPLSLVLWIFIFQKKKNFFPIALFFLVLFVYFLLRFIVFPISISGSYNISFNMQILKTLFWYLIWNFNLPEEIKYQTLTIHNLSINPKFVIDFPKESFIFFVTFFSFLIFTIGFPLFNLIVKRTKVIKEKNIKIFIFGLLWWLTSLSPVILMPKHQYPLYLTIPSLGLFLSISLLLKTFRKKLISITILFSWFVLSYAGVRFEEKIHWTVRQTKEAKEYLLEKALKKYSRLPSESVIVIPSKFYIPQSLMQQYAFWVFYNDSTLKVHYGPFLDIPPDCDDYKIYREKLQCLEKHKIYIID